MEPEVTCTCALWRMLQIRQQLEIAHFFKKALDQAAGAPSKHTWKYRTWRLMQALQMSMLTATHSLER